MRDLSRFRRYELGFVFSIATLYVGRRLYVEADHLNDTIGLAATGNGIPAGAFWRYLDGYEHTLNNNVPLIAGMIFLLIAWYLFHMMAYPKLRERLDDRIGWGVVALAMVGLLTSAFVYHYLKLYVRYQHDQAGNIIGLAVFSRYSKRTVVADAIGLGILVVAYQLLFQLFNYLHTSLAAELPERQRRISYLPFVGVMATLISLAVMVDLPLTLWRGGFRDALLVMGLVCIVLCLQTYVYSYIIPLLKTSSTSQVLRGSRIGTYLLIILPFLRTSSTPEIVLAKRVATFLLLIITSVTIMWGASTGFYYQSFARGPMLPFCFIILSGAIAIAYGRHVFTKEKTVLQTQVSTGAAELASLRAQINPHFLFNALNSLYATALKENSEKTADGIQKLGDMMRFLLQENNRDRIPLDKEIEYLRNYIQLQRMRIDESHNIEIRVNIQEPSPMIYLAPMLLTPFVENAFKHGISLRHPSWIYITLTLDATRLYFKVHNSRHSRPTDDPEEDHSGVGLANVRKRLELIYPGRYQLDSQQSGQDYFISLSLIYQGEFKIDSPLPTG